jgi:hypothetical protein
MISTSPVSNLSVGTGWKSADYRSLLDAIETHKARPPFVCPFAEDTPENAEDERVGVLLPVASSAIQNYGDCSLFDGLNADWLVPA